MILCGRCSDCRTDLDPAHFDKWVCCSRDSDFTFDSAAKSAFCNVFLAIMIRPYTLFLMFMHHRSKSVASRSDLTKTSKTIRCLSFLYFRSLRMLIPQKLSGPALSFCIGEYLHPVRCYRQHLISSLVSPNNESMFSHVSSSLPSIFTRAGATVQIENLYMIPSNDTGQSIGTFSIVKGHAFYSKKTRGRIDASQITVAWANR